MVFDHEADYPCQWVAIGIIAPKIGWTPETLRSWPGRPSVIRVAVKAPRRQSVSESRRWSVRTESWGKPTGYFARRLPILP